MLNGIFPSDPNESAAFAKIVDNNPGYGLPFWELIRTIAKDHGAYFVPDLSLDEEFAKIQGTVASQKFSTNFVISQPETLIDQKLR